MSTEWLTQKNEPGSGFHLLSKILVRKGESTWSCHCVYTTILLQASWCVVHQVRCPPRYPNRSKIAIPFLRLHFYRFSFLLHTISCKGPKHAAELTITTVQLYQLLIFGVHCIHSTFQTTNTHNWIDRMENAKTRAGWHAQKMPSQHSGQSFQ